MFVPFANQVAELPAGTPALRTMFMGLSLGVALLFPLAVYHSGILARIAPIRVLTQSVFAAGATVFWLAITFGAANAGLLRFSPAPPTVVFVLIAVLILAMGTTASPIGKRIAAQVPLIFLIGFQAFRILVELLLHRAYEEGLMPVQMSYSGRNFDIVSGITAILMMVWIARGGRSPRVVFLWNTLGLALLVNILTVAMLSAPLPFRVFMNEPSNIWITHAPWVWLPAVLVLAALTGHLLVYRRLWVERRSTRPTG